MLHALPCLERTGAQAAASAPVVGDVVGDAVDAGVLVVDELDGRDGSRHPLGTGAPGQERLQCRHTALCWHESLNINSSLWKTASRLPHAIPRPPKICMHNGFSGASRHGARRYIDSATRMCACQHSSAGFPKCNVGERYRHDLAASKALKFSTLLPGTLLGWCLAPFLSAANHCLLSFPTRKLRELSHPGKYKHEGGTLH